mgnify:CR=1 FL=1
MSPISNASRLADFGSGIGTAGAIIQVDNTNQRVGIGTTNPQAMLQVGTAISMFGSTGIVSATAFYGDGANLDNVTSGVELQANGSSAGSAITTINFSSGASITDVSAGISTISIAAGLGTALGDSAPLDTIFKTPYILYVGATGAGTTIRIDSDATSGNVAFMRQKDVYIAAGSTISNNVDKNGFSIARAKQQIIKNGRSKFLKE